MRPQEFILSRQVNRSLHAEIVRHQSGGAYVVGVRFEVAGPIYSGATSALRPGTKGKDRPANDRRGYAYAIRVWPKKL